MNIRQTIGAAITLLLLLTPATVLAHCDTMDGPVVSAARQALETGNVNSVLIWVQPADEAQIKQAFERAVAVRKLNPEARDLADTYFFETLVRVHRAGEGAPYTGLKPAGRDVGPAIPAVDKALQDGSVQPVITLLTEAMQDGVRERFAAAQSAKSFDKNDVAAGRRYVKAYVPLLHYVEGIYRASVAGAEADHGHAGGVAHED